MISRRPESSLPPGEFERIIVIATQQIGDVLLTTPLIRAARRRWPKARIDVLGMAGTMGMLSGNPDINEVIEVRRGESLKDKLRMAARLWRRYDLALITRGGDRAHLYGFVAARVRCGLVSGPQDAGRWWKLKLATYAVDEKADMHSMLEKLALIEPWVGEGAQVPEVVPPAAAALPDDIARVLGPRPVIVHAPSMWRYKQWPVEHFKTLVSELLRDGEQVVLTGAGSAGDMAVVSEVAQVGSAPQLINAAGRLSLNQLAALLERAALYIGPDTAITHLAAACKTPTIALFGPTPPVNWGPWPPGQPAKQPYERTGARQQRSTILLLQGPGNCVPCAREGCENHRGSRSDCLIGLAPERVLSEARQLLRASASQGEGSERASASSAST